MKILKSLVFIILLSCLMLGGYLWFSYSELHPNTTDAYIDANTVTISPQISGRVQQVNVSTHQQVKKGDVLLIIDDSDYKLALNQAQVNIGLVKNQIQSASAKARSTQAQATVSMQQKADAAQQNKRTQELIKKGVIPREQADTSQFKLSEASAAAIAAQAIIQAAQAEVGQSSIQMQSVNLTIAKMQLDLSRTVITAPVDGILGEIKVQPGDFVEPGENLFPLVDVSNYWVSANFKETDLDKIRIGQSVQIDLDMYPGKTTSGHVETISPASGTAFSLIPAQNATGNWVKVTQRFPIRIKLPDADDQHPYRVGASASVTIDAVPPGQPQGIVSRILSYVNTNYSNSEKTHYEASDDPIKRSTQQSITMPKLKDNEKAK